MRHLHLEETMPPKKQMTKRAGKRAAAAASTTSARSTISGPSRKDKDTREVGDALSAKMEGTQALASAMRFNATKAAEYGRAALVPSVGVVAEPPHPRVTASTLTETLPSAKTGASLNLGTS
ncbi:MAG TPA: hypothetical protein VK427_10620, partial [Kofleriaceae bacterium]|nr:hypothetical protein [Kofleriaceae bacterium]